MSAHPRASRSVQKFASVSAHPRASRSVQKSASASALSTYTKSEEGQEIRELLRNANKKLKEVYGSFLYPGDTIIDYDQKHKYGYYEQTAYFINELNNKFDEYLACYDKNEKAKKVAIIDGENLLYYRPEIQTKTHHEMGHFKLGIEIEQKLIAEVLQKFDFVIAVDKRGEAVQHSLQHFRRSEVIPEDQLCVLTFSNTDVSGSNGIDDALIKLIALHQISKLARNYNYVRLDNLGDPTKTQLPKTIPDNSLYVFSADKGFEALRRR